MEGRRLALSNLDKVLYPATGFTKGEVLHYYATVAEALLPHLHDRPVSFLRYPDGVGRPALLHQEPAARHPRLGDRPRVTALSEHPAHQVLVDDLATLMWAANLVAGVAHASVAASSTRPAADRLVFDLDPGPRASVVECCAVALWLRERLAADGLHAYAEDLRLQGPAPARPLEPTTSSAGLGVREAARPWRPRRAAARPGDLHRMAKALRPGKVFVDHSQNAAPRPPPPPTPCAPSGSPTVSTPLTWDELAAAETAEELVFLAGAVPARLERDGDLLAPLLDPAEARPLPRR